MSGYLINLFKYPPADISSIREIGALQNHIAQENHSLVRNVVWSNLDRIEIRRINEFNNYRSAEESEKTWVGERQFAMLYDLVDETKSKLFYRTSDNSEDRCRFRFEPVRNIGLQEREEYRFFGISMVSFSPIMHKYIYEHENPGEAIHRELGKVLDDLCKSSSANFLNQYLEYEIYGTLGSADCAIVWLVNQYTDVIALVEALRKIKCTENEYFTSNVYTIMGLTNPLSSNNIFEGSKGIFNLRLIKRGEFDIADFREKLSDYVDPISDVNIVLGKYDVSVTFNSSAIKQNIYAEGMPIHFRSVDYYKSILEAHTELMQKPGEEQIEPICYRNVEITGEITLISSKTCFEEVRERIENVTKADIFCEMPYLKETIWLLYQDFVKNMASEFSYPWSVDLGYAFQKSIEYMQKILSEETNMEKSDIIAFIQNFIDSIRQTILHISQASKLYFEIPDSHLKQTGAYSKILSAYYGVIKHLLKIAYNIPKLDEQSEIIPFITFNVKPKVESEFFQPLNVKELRVVNFELPYEALTDLPKYSKLLAHEVFHYITPERRDVRNYLYGCVIWTEVIKSICYQRLVSMYTQKYKNQYSCDDWKINCGRIIYYIKDDIWNSVLENYEELMSSYIGDESCLWSEYYNNLDSIVWAIYRTDESNILRISKLVKNILEENSTLLLSVENGNECFKAVATSINEEIKSDSFDTSFLCWFLTGDALKLVSTKASDIIDACREAFADYFMIQTMKMDMAEYLLTTFEFVEIYESNGQMQMMQQLRIGMVMDYVWSKKGTLTDERLQTLVADMNLTDKQKEKWVTLWDSYEKYAKIYRTVFHYLFSTIDFEKIDCRKNVKFVKVLDDFTRKLVTYAKPPEENVFEYNRTIIENMQNQDWLKCIYDVEYLKYVDRRNLRKIVDMKKEFFVSNGKKTDVSIQGDLYKSMPAVQSLEGFMKAFDIVARELRDNEFEPLWFRGHSSSDYNLIPSLYRIKDKVKYAYKRPLKEIMEDLTDAFRVKAFHAPEICLTGNDSFLGTLVSMQHYQVETNLLDWSQQIFSSLYFALEKYVNNPDEEKPEVNARVYIFNPSRFNTMMREVMDSKMCEGHYSIPALIGDSEKFGRYLPYLNSKEGTDGDDKYNYPVAIYTPHVNPRIKAQAGCFTIFSINANGVKESDGCSYLRFDLESLQEKCKKKKGAFFKPFVRYIDIDREFVISIANSIRTMGVTKKYVYPELSNIAQEMAQEIKNTYTDDDC